MNATYAHIVLNHLPLVGLLIGTALLAFTLLRQSADIRAAALVVMAISGLLAWPVAESGEGAEDQIQTIVDSTGHSWLEAHEERAENAVPAALITAGLAILTLVAMRKRPSFSSPLSLLCLVSALISLGLIGWTAQAGGQIRHTELRGAVSPEKEH